MYLYLRAGGVSRVVTGKSTGRKAEGDSNETLDMEAREEREEGGRLSSEEKRGGPGGWDQDKGLWKRVDEDGGDQDQTKCSGESGQAPGLALVRIRTLTSFRRSEDEKEESSKRSRKGQSGSWEPCPLLASRRWKELPC